MIFKKKTYYNTVEDLLQKEADDFTMYPSNKVWNNINNELHPQKRWSILIFLFIGICIIGIVTSFMFYPKPDNPFASLMNKNRDNNLQLNKEISSQKNNPKEFLFKENKIVENNFNSLQNKKSKTLVSKFNNATIVVNTELEKNKVQAVCEKNENIIVNSDKRNTEEFNIVFTNSNDLVNNVKDEKLNKKLATVFIENANQELRIIKDPFIKKTTKTQWQFYTTPSLSYRVLSDGLAKANNINQNGIEQSVYHKASMGNEFGVAVLFPISNKIFLKTGVQFNMRKYEAIASESAAMTTVSLINNNQVTTSNIAAKYSTGKINNTKSVELDNTMYELSIPIGFQWNIVEGSKWGLITAATLQPTFSLNKTIYAVSSDYKYYVDGTQFARKGNVNTSVELLLSLKAGKGNFVFGPQFRYQQMSTFKDEYPIKENRIDYGIKVGFMQNF